MITTPTNARRGPAGFTLIELLIVVFVVGLTASTAIVLFSSSSDEEELQLVTDRLVDDLSFARTRATTHRQPIRVVFDTGRERYAILDSENAVLAHPVEKRPYVVDLATLASGHVDLVSASFGGSDTLYLAPGGRPRVSGSVRIRGPAGERDILVSAPSAVITVE